MNYSENNRTYGRKIVRNRAKRKDFRKQLFASWGICFLVGFLFGCVLVLGIHSCVNVAKAEEGEEGEVLAMIEEPEMIPMIEEPEPISLGEFKLTAYCACHKCCGKHPGDVGYGITKSGVRAVEGVTIAADPSVIPLGTEVTIDGYGEYIVQDTGSLIKGNKVDIYFEDHQVALEFGVQYKEIFMTKGGETDGEV